MSNSRGILEAYNQFPSKNPMLARERSQYSQLQSPASGGFKISSTALFLDAHKGGTIGEAKEAHSQG